MDRPSPQRTSLAGRSARAAFSHQRSPLLSERRSTYHHPFTSRLRLGSSDQSRFWLRGLPLVKDEDTSDRLAPAVPSHLSPRRLRLYRHRPRPQSLAQQIRKPDGLAHRRAQRDRQERLGRRYRERVGRASLLGGFVFVDVVQPEPGNSTVGQDVPSAADGQLRLRQASARSAACRSGRRGTCLHLSGGRGSRLTTSCAVRNRLPHRRRWQAQRAAGVERQVRHFLDWA